MRAPRLAGGSERGLDWLNFFVANLQTAFGPFVAVFLTNQHWTEGEIGVALSIGTATSMASQVPAGAVVDAIRNKRAAAALSILAILTSCLIVAFFPERLPVAVAEVLHGFASCMLNPAIAAITLLVAAGTPGALGVRFGRNWRWASIGNGIAAGLMAGAGYAISDRFVFVLASFLAAPGLLALRWIRPPTRRPKPAPNAQALPDADRDPTDRLTPHGSVWTLLREPNLLGFMACCAFFHLANAAMLPLAASEVTRVAGARAELVIGAAIVVPQIVVALLSPTLGRAAERIGRRPILLVGFAALPLRGVLLSLTSDPFLIVLIQAFDGVSSAVFGVALPLIAADLSRSTGRFNLCMGLLGLAVGVGATLSTTLGGYTAELSERVAFLALAGAGLIAVLLVLLLVRETRTPALARP